MEEYIYEMLTKTYHQSEEMLHPKFINYFAGYETARSLAFHGATVVMGCRNLEKAGMCRDKILADRPKATIEVLQLNLASLKSVKMFAEEYKRQAWYVD